MIVFDRCSLIQMLAWGKIIDIGCNIGMIFGDFATNVDISSLEELRRQAMNPSLEIPNFVQADAKHLPFLDQSYDTAVLSEILEHLEYPLDALNEAQRVAKTVLFCVPNEYQWAEVNKPFTHSEHKTNFDEQKVFDLILKSGMEFIEYYKLMYQGWSYFIVQGKSKYYKQDITKHRLNMGPLVIK